MTDENIEAIRHRLDSLLVIDWYDRKVQPQSAYNADQLLADARALLAAVDARAARVEELEAAIVLPPKNTDRYWFSLPVEFHQGMRDAERIDPEINWPSIMRDAIRARLAAMRAQR
jgi:hypothetical protein